MPLAPGEPDLADKVAHLRSDAWPGARPEEIETHMSWVFLTGNRAYKLKKPIAYELLDYRSIEARRRDCEAEVELNQSLAPGVYLGVEPLTVDEHGEMSIGGSGRAVDWLVVMRRLPCGELLDHRIADATVGPADLDGVVDRLVDHYSLARPLPMDPADYRRQLADQLDRDVAGLRRHGRWLDVESVEALAGRLAGGIGSSPTVGERAARLVDGHGDLRPEHIVPGPPPLIIDRLSFAARLRQVDPLFDLALLALECDVLAAPALGAHALERYQARSGDRVEASLVELYQAVRALTRARLSIAHLDDGVHDPRHWVRRSRRYVEVCQSHLARTG